MTTAKNSQSNKKDGKKDGDSNLEIIQQNLSKNRITEPVIIPSSINTSKVKKVNQQNNSTNENKKSY